jgi:hypothetical protein
MTDAELEQRAQAYVQQRYGNKAYAARRLMLESPPGLYYAVAPVLTPEDLRHHPATRPGILGDGGFFISRTTGDIEQLPPVVSSDPTHLRRLGIPKGTAKLLVTIVKGLAASGS